MSHHLKVKGRILTVEVQGLPPELERKLIEALGEDKVDASLVLDSGITLKIHDTNRSIQKLLGEIEVSLASPEPVEPFLRPVHSPEDYRLYWDEVVRDQTRQLHKRLMRDHRTFAPAHIPGFSVIPVADVEYRPISENPSMKLKNVVIDSVSIVKDPPNPDCKVVKTVSMNQQSKPAPVVELTIGKVRDVPDAWDHVASHSGIGKDAVGQADAGVSTKKLPDDTLDVKYPLGVYNSDGGKLTVVSTSYDYITKARTYEIRYHGSAQKHQVTEHYLSGQNLRAPR